jgi:hypothetical protein
MTGGSLFVRSGEIPVTLSGCSKQSDGLRDATETGIRKATVQGEEL